MATGLGDSQHVPAAAATGDVLRVVLVPVDGRPLDVIIEPRGDEEAFDCVQDLVGGAVEFLSVGCPCEGVDLIVNAEGLLFGLPPNRAIYANASMEAEGLLSQVDFSHVVRENDLYTVLHGPIVVAGFDLPSGDTVSLTDAQADSAKRYFERVSPPGSGAWEERLIRAAVMAARDATCAAREEASEIGSDER